MDKGTAQKVGTYLKNQVNSTPESSPSLRNNTVSEKQPEKKTVVIEEPYKPSATTDDLNPPSPRKVGPPVVSFSDVLSNL